MISLRPSTVTVDWQLCRSMAQLSAEVYHTANISAPETDVHVNVAHVNGHILVGFRGSESILNFLEDAEIWRQPLLWSADDLVAEVHHGFLACFESVHQEVLHAVRNLVQEFPADEVYIYGHSLGGALDIFCAFEFYRQKLPVTGVYTFGCPRVGNDHFARLYNAALGDRTFRVVNQNDIVPRLAPLETGYRHVGQEIFMPPFGSWVVNPNPLFKLFADGAGLWNAFKTRQEVLAGNHFMASYLAKMNRLHP